MMRRTTGLFLAGLISLTAYADVPLIGMNIPDPSLLDGDFDRISSGWRAAKQSPHWTCTVHKGGHKAGLAEGRISSGGNPLVTYESPILDQTQIKSLAVGDVLAWRFAANTEYPCDGRVSLSLVFGDQERVVAGRIKVPNGPAKPKVYEGFYTVTSADAKAGMPIAKFTMESDHGIMVYVDWVDLKVMSKRASGLQDLGANAIDAGIQLSWKGDPRATFTVYRSNDSRKGFQRVAQEVAGNQWIDRSIISGKKYFYALKNGDLSSKVVEGQKIDSHPPSAPHAVGAVGKDWVVQLKWETHDADIAHYNVYRRDSESPSLSPIAYGVTKSHFEDMLPIKGGENIYAIEAVDYSRNVGPLSAEVNARVKMRRGASFSDLLLPMPIHQQLRSDLWGAENVLPRDPDNGVEHPDWTYWGGKVIKDPADDLYHILVTRWPEGDRKGHWAWPYSTVAHVVSENPTGPYVEKEATVYDLHRGLGHNPNIIVLNDGSYALYSLVNWKACIFTSKSMNGPWKYEGEMAVEHDADYLNSYRLYRNLSGVQCEDGSFLFVTKAGAMMRSTEGILGPYQVLTEPVGENLTIPEHYRKSNYEDPTMWYDGLQYHMIINAFLDYRAIYLRSIDGVNWKYEQGLAYTPTCTVYEDGTRTFWYKVERPNVLQDEYGRATHLSLAAIDVKKDYDYGNDKHSAKHLIIPLVVNKRLSMLNSAPVDKESSEVRVLIQSEAGFNAQEDLDLESLRFGASESVNVGGGAVLKESLPHKDGLVLVFGSGCGISDANFVCKLIGKTKGGELVVGYSALKADLSSAK